MNKNKIGVLFDLDGVLIDTETQYSLFWGAIGEKYLDHHPDFAKRIKGCNLASILDPYFPNPSDKEDIVQQLEEFQNNMKYELFPGVKEFIQELQNNDIPMCIVTSSDNNKMNTLFSRLPYIKETFTNIITGDQVTKSKPDPECFLLGASKINVDISNCYIFEDSIQGIKAGIASGGKVIALSTTNSAESISEYTETIIPNLNGFIVEKMLSL